MDLCQFEANLVHTVPEPVSKRRDRRKEGRREGGREKGWTEPSRLTSLPRSELAKLPRGPLPHDRVQATQRG